jgi:hypothetical protein
MDAAFLAGSHITSAQARNTALVSSALPPIARG